MTTKRTTKKARAKAGDIAKARQRVRRGENALTLRRWCGDFSRAEGVRDGR